MKFEDLNLSPSIVNGLSEKNIIYPTEIQLQSIGIVLANPQKNIIGQAKTGSGKTLAFAVPMVENLNLEEKFIQGIVMVPTRELCKQVSNVFQSITKYKKANIVEIYGGVSIKKQIEKIRNSGQIIIATPGRLIDLYRRRQINLERVKYVAIDEADRMLDMGFLPDMQVILLEAMKYNKPQLFLFSATLLENIKNLVSKFSQNKEIIELNVSKDSLIVKKCIQIAYITSQNKYLSLLSVLYAEKPEYLLIFTKTKRKSEEISRKLKKEHYLNLKVGVLNGNMTQSQREKTLMKFRSKKINCLVGTNVLARGLDFPSVSHVINFDLPRDPEDYVHRIGRTARISGKDKITQTGKAISLVSAHDQILLRNIEKLIKYRIKKESFPSLPPELKAKKHNSSKSNNSQFRTRNYTKGNIRKRRYYSSRKNRQSKRKSRNPKTKIIIKNI